MTQIPQELNWVEKRAACTAEKLFPNLVEDVKSDVKTRNALGSDSVFACGLSSTGKVLTVGETGNWARKDKVRFQAGHGRIEVTNENHSVLLAAEVFLNDEGRCKLKLADGSEMEMWQFRKKALENLFFGDAL